MRWGRIALAGGVCLILALLWIFYGEPQRLEITHHSVRWGLRQPLKIAHLTDLHSDHIGSLERKVIAALEREKVDLLVMTGDLSTPHRKHRGNEGYLQLLQALPKARLGHFFVRGNWEYWEAIPALEQLLEAAQIVDLTQRKIEIQPGLWLLGFDDPTGRFRPQPLLGGLPPQTRRIGLAHSPGVFPQLAPELDLLLSGHTHGGQIQLPFWGAPFLPPHSGNYSAGWYQQGQSRLYVSRGIGTSVLPVRFLARPELAIFEIE